MSLSQLGTWRNRVYFLPIQVLLWAITRVESSGMPNKRTVQSSTVLKETPWQQINEDVSEITKGAEPYFFQETIVDRALWLYLCDYLPIYELEMNGSRRNLSTNVFELKFKSVFLTKARLIWLIYWKSSPFPKGFCITENRYFKHIHNMPKFITFSTIKSMIKTFYQCDWFYFCFNLFIALFS